MSEGAFLGALLRALPLCCVLPLPGLAARLALTVILAVAGLGAPGADQLGLVSLGPELARGAALGLATAAPLYAARWAGALLGLNLGRGIAGGGVPVQRVASVLGWVIFCAAGGADLLMRAYLQSYARWPTTSPPTLDVAALPALLHGGADLFALAAQLAVPALLVLALVEICAGFLSRFERTAGFDADAVAMARLVRPIVVAVLLVGSVAAFTRGVGAAVLSASQR